MQNANKIKATNVIKPIEVAVRSAAARVLLLRFQSPAGVWMSVSSESCVMSGRERTLRRANSSSRGVLSSMVCLGVISKLQNEVA
jgi:hypothetical protein